MPNGWLGHERQVDLLRQRSMHIDDSAAAGIQKTERVAVWRVPGNT